MVIVENKLDIVSILVQNSYRFCFASASIPLRSRFDSKRTKDGEKAQRNRMENDGVYRL